MATIVINNKFLHIRKITEHDVKESYYTDEDLKWHALRAL